VLLQALKVELEAEDDAQMVRNHMAKKLSSSTFSFSSFGSFGSFIGFICAATAA
jgi:hypothetical protein